MRYARLQALCVLLALVGTGSGAYAKNRAVEYMKYFSPMPQKNYLNESQDRLIKKQSFKAATLPSFPPATNKECGFFAIVPPDKVADREFVLSLLKNEKTNGISVIIPWKNLEPAEEKYDWAAVDQLLELCKQTNKSVILRVSTCGVDLPSEGDKVASDTPAWVFESGSKSVKYLDGAGKAHLMPIFWDQNYLAAFSNFVTEMGSRYNKNELIHSVGITGGGFLGGTSLVPTTITRKGGEKTVTNETGFTTAEQIEAYLRKEHGLTQKQIIDHWKYAADLFPAAFPNTALNFAINPPTPNRAGEDALDQISDYLIYRYGQHIFTTRQDIKDGKHGFDDWRVLVKFKPDTFQGLALLPGTLKAEDMEKISKTALDDGISYMEIPVDVLQSKDDIIVKSIDKLYGRLGYQLVTQKASLPSEVGQAEPLKADFTFLNVGAAMPKRAVREMDKDVSTSYKLMVELKDSTGKPVAQLLKTPEKGTNDWKAGVPVTFQDSFKMPALPLGEYTATLSVYDPENKRRLNFIDGRTDKPVTTDAIAVGTVKVVAAAAPATTSAGPNKGVLESMKKDTKSAR